MQYAPTMAMRCTITIMLFVVLTGARPHEVGLHRARHAVPLQAKIAEYLHYFLTSDFYSLTSDFYSLTPNFQSVFLSLLLLFSASLRDTKNKPRDPDIPPINLGMKSYSPVHLDQLQPGRMIEQPLLTDVPPS